MSLGHTEICELLPHTGAMCLLESVQTWDAEGIVCTAVSHRDPANPLRRDGMLPAVCGIEYAAQSIGVHGRLVADNRAKPAAGYLASLRDIVLHADRIDDAGAVLTIETCRLAGTGESVMCEFRVRAAERELVRGRATLLLEVA
jgi:predicted hotdog family 3-hydroxylacyl-ACP dehydratase